jgi:predicted patatin/cPLA2 family phospholipase
MEAECFGRGNNSHAVCHRFSNSRRKFVRYSDVSEYVELFAPYSGTNCINADDLEKRVHEKLMGWPQHRRMFVHAGVLSGNACSENTLPVLHRCVGM